MKDWYWTNRARQADRVKLVRRNKIFNILYKLNLMKHSGYGYGHERTILECIDGLCYSIKYHIKDRKSRQYLWFGIDEYHWFQFNSTYYDGNNVSLTFCGLYIAWWF